MKRDAAAKLREVSELPGEERLVFVLDGQTMESLVMKGPLLGDKVEIDAFSPEQIRQLVDLINGNMPR